MYNVDSPIEIAIGTIFLYQLLGVSAFIGLAMTCLFLPLNHLAGKIVVGAQDNLMKARDERVSLMNEVRALSLSPRWCDTRSWIHVVLIIVIVQILGAIRMLKVRDFEHNGKEVVC